MDYLFNCERKFEEIHVDPELQREGRSFKTMNEDNTIVLIENKAPEGLRIGAHFHDWLEFSLLLSGEQEVIHGSRSYITSSGDFMMFGYNEVHSIYSRKDSRKVTFQFKKEYLKRVVPHFHSHELFCCSSQILDVESYYKYNELKD